MIKIICDKNNCCVSCINKDLNHLHFILEAHPNICLSNIIRSIKSYTSFHIFFKYKNVLKKCLWKENAFWSDGYFICSIENVSNEKLIDYILNQKC